MAQTGYTPILIYSSTTASQAPAAGNLTNSTLGSELAINITDGKLFYKDNGGSVQVIAWKVTPTTAGGTGLTSYTAGDTLYYATGTTLSKLAIGASKTIMTSSGTAPQWSASLDTTQGGTGLTSYTAGDLPYYATGTALSKLGIGSANTVLTSSGTAPQWTAQSSLSVGTAANLLSNATTGVMQIVGPGTGTTRVMTIPNANFTAARTDAAQTFTGLQQFNTGIQTNNETDLVFATTSSATGEKSIVQWLIEDASEMASIRASRVNSGGDGSIDFYTRGSGPSTLAAKFNNFGTLRMERDNLYFAVAGKGVDFGANSGAAGKTSTLLNWYEEGTWTPTLKFGGGNTGITYTVNSGSYTRIGRLVSGRFIIVLSNKGSSTGAATIEGLPFTVGSDIGSAVTNYCSNFASAPPTAGYPNNTGTNISIWSMGATGVSIATDTNFANDTRLDMWFQYYV